MKIEGVTTLTIVRLLGTEVMVYRVNTGPSRFTCRDPSKTLSKNSTYRNRNTGKSTNVKKVSRKRVKDGPVSFVTILSTVGKNLILLPSLYDSYHLKVVLKISSVCKFRNIQGEQSSYR